MVLLRFSSICTNGHPCSSQVLTNQCFCVGVSIIEGGESGITMELEMNWDGNPSIVLDIKTRLGVSLPVQVRFQIFSAISWKKKV